MKACGYLLSAQLLQVHRQLQRREETVKKRKSQLDNAINKGRPLITAKELCELMDSGEKYILIDTRVPNQYEKSHIQTAINIPLENLRSVAKTLDKKAIIITYCNKGTTGNAAQNVLLNKGFEKVYNISGGYKTFSNWKTINGSSDGKAVTYY
jgi:rhodanese-related sulfurtransferase